MFRFRVSAATFVTVREYGALRRRAAISYFGGGGEPIRYSATFFRDAVPVRRHVSARIRGVCVLRVRHVYALFDIG